MLWNHVLELAPPNGIEYDYSKYIVHLPIDQDIMMKILIL